MTNIDRNPPGNFCWIELSTSNQNAAKQFYGGLFGWDANDSPIGPNEFYTMFEIGSRAAAAGYTMRVEQREQGVPPHWGIYIEVTDADASAAKAKELGGTVLAAPFDVMEIGRMAVLQDPTGTTFCIWQSKSSTGFRISGVSGTFCWADLSTPDPAKAIEFYSGLFGWKFGSSEHDSSGYLHIKNGEQFIGGLPPVAHRRAGTPPHWLSYIQVDDVDATATKAEQLGGKLYLAPMSMEGVGRMSVIADPQGAVFAIFKSAR